MVFVFLFNIMENVQPFTRVEAPPRWRHLVRFAPHGDSAARRISLRWRTALALFRGKGVRLQGTSVGTL